MILRLLSFTFVDLCLHKVCKLFSGVILNTHECLVCLHAKLLLKVEWDLVRLLAAELKDSSNVLMEPSANHPNINVLNEDHEVLVVLYEVLVHLKNHVVLLKDQNAHEDFHEKIGEYPPLRDN